MKVEKTLAVMAKYVLTTARYWPTPVAKAPLKLGQNTQRKRVPVVMEGGNENEGRELGREEG